VQHIKLGSKDIDSGLNTTIQNVFDFMNKDFYHLETMLVPICPELPMKVKEMEI
jgi:hypothetical protein